MIEFDAETMFSDAELVRAFNGAGIQTGGLPDAIMARGLRCVAQLVAAKVITSQAPALERIADSLEKLAAATEIR